MWEPGEYKKIKSVYYMKEKQIKYVYKGLMIDGV